MTILRAVTILSFSITSPHFKAVIFLKKMLNVAQLHLRFFCAAISELSS